MKKPQWIAIIAAVVLVAVIYGFGKIVPPKKTVTTAENQHSDGDGHDHGNLAELTTDSVLAVVKKKLTPEQAFRLNSLENSIKRGDVKQQQLRVYHQLSHFWRDTVRFFEPYAWYEAEAARLENSEKTLTFAAHLFLDNLREEEDLRWRKWKALQAKDLFERSLQLNPANDSAKVGLGACYLFGNISNMPMEGIKNIREVVDKDSTNVYAQLTLVEGQLMTGQNDKAIERLHTVMRIDPENVKAMWMLGDVYERTNEKAKAVGWYEKSLAFPLPGEIRRAVEERIAELKK